MTKDKTYILNREKRIISQREVVQINSATGGPLIQLAVFEVKSNYTRWQDRYKIRTEYDARWRVPGSVGWNYRSIHRSQRAALREVLLLKENAEGLAFYIKENVTA